ncbi:ABSCISIC ACID-INSENSITIVE 5-like protein [Quillaja saponaria]|uniref:ABSCISIC ACID-INSENSITIVE 5-like protein n=1 Tax=Quillaja saponaria TaxID=32244 RepID=A0AAD7KUW4_QUISA|nr:ABSCISIC ACID-INSENSITIVE 5-like protein [Quillaja saponaria]
MGSHMNFKNFGDALMGEGSGVKSPGNFALARQSSVYSLTFEEFQNSLGGFGKDFGSMNMDELLKNIWTAEETQAVTPSIGGGEGTGGNLQRQGSLTLPRTLSQKTVDEVWKDLMKESGGAKDANGTVVTNVPQRQRTLGEMTLEEFLVRAGVVREDAQQNGRPNNNEFFADFSGPNNNSGLLAGFQQASQNNELFGNRMTESNNSVPSQPASLVAINVSGINSSQQHTRQAQQQLQLPLFPKPTNVAFTRPLHLAKNAHLASPGTRGGAIGVPEPSINNSLLQSSALQGGGTGMVGLATGNVTVAAGSSAGQISSNVIIKSSGDTSSLSPVPYLFSRGRKNNALEKVVERRQKRMIKNRESAARSRARKQAYTLELEAEIAKLKEVNQELQTKQAEFMEMQKNQILETMNRQWGGKWPCLRRTLTGPW